MTWQLIAKMLTAAAPSIANHLWQSTAFLAAAWLLTLALHKNHARVRYGIWLAASIKFLIPFAFLISLGSFLSRPGNATIAQSGLYSAAGEISLPFTQAVAPIVQPVSHMPHFAFLSLLPELLLAAWLFGFAAVLGLWWLRWRRVSAAMRSTLPISQGREADMLRQLERSAGVRKPIALLLSRDSLEPGICGILRPVLLWPAGISKHLDDAHLKAILAHEVWHVRRRDNLTAAIHMLVEAAFWFHPLVWWVGTRLVAERERACDEEVLRLGNRAQMYAEGILKTCEFCVASPLACISGVTGADLKQRIVRIMSEHVARKLDFSRKLLLSVAGLLAITFPVVFGLLHTARSQAQVPAQQTAQDIAGTWQGTLHAGRDLRTVIKISKADGGAWKAVFYSIDQPGQGIPANSVTLQGSTLKISILEIGGSYEGTLSPNGQSISGTWTQSQPLPLNLQRVTDETAWTIPAPPPPPKPMAADADPEFEVATIKPGKPDTRGRRFWFEGRQFSAFNNSLDFLIAYAYGIQTKQIIGAPAWGESDKYDILAESDGQGQPSLKQWKLMLQKLLADRFQLKFHHEKRDLSVYAITVGKNGPKLTKSASDPNGLPILRFGLGDVAVTNATMEDFARIFQEAVLDRPVVDQTGLNGRFDLVLKWTPDESQFGALVNRVPPRTDDPDAPPDLFTAIQEQLGLKLESKKGPVDVLVIDHVEKPSPN